MTEPDDPGDGPDLCGIGWLDGWTSPAERRDALFAEAAEAAAEKRRDQRKRLAREIATIKAMQKAGVPVRAATIDGVKLEFGGQAEAPDAKSNVTELDQWISTHVRPA
jgi:hypothetical protein